MGRHRRRLERLLNGRADAAMRLDEVRNVLNRLGFVESEHGSHRVFRHPRGAKIVLATHRAVVPAYQIRDVRRILGHYGLTETQDD